jgi:tripartite ATP-independent transporter DctM subunit
MSNLEAAAAPSPLALANAGPAAPEIPSGHANSEAARHEKLLPGWMKRVDNAVLWLLNITLVLQVVLVFAGTMARAIFHSSALMGIDELSPLFLVTLAFLGGAVAYSRGQFIAINLVVDRLPEAWREYLRGAAEWIVILVSLLIGGYSVPLLLSTMEEKTVLLEMSYAWTTLPITAGSLLFVLHAGISLARRSWAAKLVATAVVALPLLAFFASSAFLGAHPSLLYGLLFVLFFGLTAIGVPVGFVLAVIGVACVQAMGSADMVSVVVNAQRGSGGFIFLALPFFILAGFIMDKADVGLNIVEFIGSLIGHFKGGLLQVMIIGVYISSCISGSKAADMAMVGLPMNKKLNAHGYAPEERAALLAASAAMAESVPPSIALILLGSATSISTGALFIAGLIPAATMGLCLMAVVRIRATSARWTPIPRAPASEVMQKARKAVLPLMMPAILIGGIVGGIGTPTEVSTFAVLYALGLGLLNRKINAKNFWSILTQASLLNGMVFFTVSAATIFSWALTLEGVTTAIAVAVAGLGAATFLPAVIVITVLLGALLESFVTIVILAPLLLPVAQQLGIDPLHYGIVMAQAFGLGVILPPIGIALYVACAICGAKVERATKPMMLYLSVLLAGLVLVMFFPAITTFLPHLLGFKS